MISSHTHTAAGTVSDESRIDRVRLLGNWNCSDGRWWRRLRSATLIAFVGCICIGCNLQFTRFSTWNIFPYICRLDYQTRRWTTSRGCDNRMSLNWYRSVLKLSWLKVELADKLAILEANWSIWCRLMCFVTVARFVGGVHCCVWSEDHDWKPERFQTV